MDPVPAPYAEWLVRLAEDTARRAEEIEPPASPHGGAPDELRTAVTVAVEEVADDLVALSHDIHEHPELGYEEHHAVEAVARILGRHGLDAEVGAFDLPTALRSRAGDGRPRVAVIAEYDALPGIGHACGHNVICATAVGAFLALARVAGDLDGSVELLGTPAGEGGGGKELIARAGGFDEIDAVVMLHPAGFEVSEHPWLGVRTVDVRYTGLAAHASMTPFMGRNALDAVVAAYQGIAALRQHIFPTDRVHGIITDGGQKPNIVPERAAASFFLRSAAPETLAMLVDRATDVFESAARATATEVRITWDPTPLYLPVRNSHTLALRYAENVATRGRRALPAGIVPGFLTGSTDLGNVSVRVPSIHPTIQIAPPGTSIHAPEFATWAAGEQADRATVDGAVGLALTALDYLSDEALRKDVAEEFDAAGGRLDLDALFD